MSRHLIGFGLLFCCLPSCCQKLDPEGKNVCLYHRDPSTLVCCSGWRQEGSECTKPVCEGEEACQPNEICVHPGVCRCKHGFYGAWCKTPCPPEFWGPDCHELCQCHPHGRCHPETGKCTCLPNRWGKLCQNACRCSRHGRCDPEHGNCTCDEGWWTPTCSRPCPCNAGKSTCDPNTGTCLCAPQYWGPRCTLPCNCNNSPCTQSSGICKCQHDQWGLQCENSCHCNRNHSQCDMSTGECICHPGFKGPVCNEPCSAGYYGAGCEKRCGHCEEGQPCSAVDGFCAACEPGWNGTRCDQPCLPGYHGHLCLEVCPRCRNAEPCDHGTGRCSSCDPGWTGPRCERICANGTYGDGCRFLCGPCFHGECDSVTGSCLCQPGFQGESCNSSCPAHFYGANCSSACACGEHTCHPVTGECNYSSWSALITSLLVPVLLVLLVLICCCCCCAKRPIDEKDRVAVGDGGKAVQMKHHVYSVLANVSSTMPCLSLWSSGLPRVTVSHHDPELTFNHSFIEPPSSGWVSDNSSFESDEGEALYCVPPREDISAVAGGEFQEMSSKCNMFPDPSGFSSEDMALAFSIPRTSSIAKAKRPSVSFAEGTKFTPKERRGSAQEALGAGRKSKSPWGVLMLSSRGESELEGDGETPEGRDKAKEEAGEDGESRHQDTEQSASASSRTSVSTPGGRPRTLSSTRRHAQQASSNPVTSDTGADKITTVYVTVNRPGRSAKAEPSSEGPVQAMLRRLGSLQRQREEGSRSRGRGDSITKPPRRKLGARVSMWEQAAAGMQSEVIMRKPSHRKHTPLSSPGAVGSTEPWQEGTTPRRPLSSILTSVPEHHMTAGSDGGASCSSDAQAGNSYQTGGSDAGSTSLGEVIENQATADDGPSYENVLIKHS